ncbi:MAG: phage terminase large subunit [Candidatus Sulfopaludibacter sp.]|nr:phage terminase large subunit [Candidatus Sulfopaludibacter sp.]
MGGPVANVAELTIPYRPLPSQRAFHDCLSRFKGFSGPIGSGKSQALCQEAIKLSYLNAGRTGLLGAPTYPMLRDATQACLLELLEDSGIRYDHNKSENTIIYRDTRSKILLRAVDEFERLRGTNLAWFGLDELTYTQEASWLRLEGRLRDPKATRLAGFAAWTPKGFDWVYKKFIAPDRPDGYMAVRAVASENRYLLDKVPDFYKQLANSYDEKFYRQEVLGEYLNLTGGMVYTSFSRDANVRPVTADLRRPLLWALDFNVDPMSSLVAQRAGSKVVILDEIVIRNGTTREAAEEFLKRFSNHESEVVIYGDASGNQQQTTGSTDYQIIREYFAITTNLTVTYQVPKSNPMVRDRINLTNSKLRSAAGEQELLVDPRCTELIKDFEQVAYKTDSCQIDKDKDRLRTHLSDALGYLLWQECRPVAKIGERGGRLF